MELRMFLREAYGVPVTEIAASCADPQKPVGAEFYSQLFSKLKEIPRDPAWIEAKRDFARFVDARFFQSWQQSHAQAPRLLTVGSGEAVAERVWADKGYPITFHDGHDACFPEIQNAYPNAKFLVSGLEELAPTDTFDFITILASDYVLPRIALVELFRRLGRSLSGNGRIFIFCPNLLSLRRLTIESLRQIVRAHRRNGYVFWGWWRSPGEFSRVAQAAGLVLKDTLRPSPSGWIPAGLLWRFIPLRDEMGCFTLGHK